MSTLKGTIQGGVGAGKAEGTLNDRSMSSMDESFNNRTMQYTERSAFQEDVAKA